MRSRRNFITKSPLRFTLMLMAGDVLISLHSAEYLIGVSNSG